MIILPDLVVIILISSILIVNTIIDLRKSIICISSIIGMLLIYIVYLLLSENEINLISSFLGLAVGGIPYLIMAIANKGGGGDAILMGALGFVLGVQNIVYLILIISAIYLLFLSGSIIKKHIKKNTQIKKQYPYVPFVTAGWIIFIILGYLI